MSSPTGRDSRARAEKHQYGNQTEGLPGGNLEVSLAEKGPTPHEHESIQEIGPISREKEKTIGKMGSDPSGQILGHFRWAAGIRWIFW